MHFVILKALISLFIMIQQSILQLFQKALVELNVSLPGDVNLEVPKDRTHGDYATNVAMQLSKQLKKNPKDIAQELVGIVQRLDEDSDFSLIRSLEIAGPGFINVFISNEALSWELSSVL